MHPLRATDQQTVQSSKLKHSKSATAFGKSPCACPQPHTFKPLFTTKRMKTARTDLPISITIKAMYHISQFLVCPCKIMSNCYSSEISHRYCPFSCLCNNIIHLNHSKTLSEYQEIIQTEYCFQNIKVIKL